MPAARSNNWLKSRLFRGSWLTAWLESATPPVVSGSAAAACSASVPSSVQGKDDVACFQSDGLRIGDAMAVHGDKKRKETGRELAEKEGAVGLRDRDGFVPCGPISSIVAPLSGLPAALRSTPFQPAAPGAVAGRKGSPRVIQTITARTNLFPRVKRGYSIL